MIKKFNPHFDSVLICDEQERACFFEKNENYAILSKPE